MLREAFARCSRMREQYVEKKRRADGAGEEGSRRIVKRGRMERDGRQRVRGEDAKECAEIGSRAANAARDMKMARSTSMPLPVDLHPICSNIP